MSIAGFLKNKFSDKRDVETSLCEEIRNILFSLPEEVQSGFLNKYGTVEEAMADFFKLSKRLEDKGAKWSYEDSITFMKNMIEFLKSHHLMVKLYLNRENIGKAITDIIAEEEIEFYNIKETIEENSALKICLETLHKEKEELIKELKEAKKEIKKLKKESTTETINLEKGSEVNGQ